MPGPLREALKSVPKMRESYKILRQEPPKSRPQELSYKHLYDMASPRASCEGLLERISPGSPQDLLFRTCTRIMQGPLERNLAGSPQEPFMWQFTLNMSQGKSLRTPWRGLCASLRSRNAHGHLRRAISCDNLQEKCRAPEVSRTFCASLRSRNALGHLARASLCENLLQKKTQSRWRTVIYPWP